MLTTILFVLSAVCCILFLIKAVSVCLGNSITVPLPILYHIGVNADNSYIAFPALCYQTYFWANYYSLLT